MQNILNQILEKIDSVEFAKTPNHNRTIQQLFVEHFPDKDNIIEEVKILLQAESNALSFNLSDRGLGPTFIGSLPNGQPYEYPSLALFTLTDLDYIEKRAARTENPVLKSRYCHLLWISPKKHSK